MEENLNYIEYIKNRYIKKYKIENKEQYFYDLLNIQRSFSGRIDIINANPFIMESVQLIINSISIFEMGYFDAAYYLLREAIEISTTILYLADMPKNNYEMFEAWKNMQNFPMQGQMLQQLYQNGTVMSDMKEKMIDFFDEINDISKKINKYVHKQGSKYFYVCRNHPISRMNDDEIYIKNYIFFLEKTIGIVAVMRLAIDPYPVLLMDEEILLRCFDSITEAYRDDFVKKYIDKKTLNDYKNTNIYINHYNKHIKEEKKSTAIFNIMKYKIINTTEKQKILSQIHLLDKIDIYATYIALSCEKVVKVYSVGGIIIMYFTDKESKREETFGVKPEFLNFEKNEEKYNQKYDEAYISVFKYILDDGKEETFFVEHNEILNKEDIEKINNLKYD